MGWKMAWKGWKKPCTHPTHLHTPSHTCAHMQKLLAIKISKFQLKSTLKT